MADQDVIDGLIATYRDLNAKVRPLSEERLRLGEPQDTVRGVVTRLRDDELRFSQALKDSLTGVPIPNLFGADAPVLANERADEATSSILAQFGTARESTLAMLRALDPTQWDHQSNGTPSVRARARELLANDRRCMERIISLLGSPA
ncbi:MAG: hypothetical protein IT337_10730 [Thermomicrobiales bacterium]|nr:hypothetical protein [Thermomicrobiales bacterium]